MLKLNRAAYHAGEGVRSQNGSFHIREGSIFLGVLALVQSW